MSPRIHIVDVTGIGAGLADAIQHLAPKDIVVTIVPSAKGAGDNPLVIMDHTRVDLRKTSIMDYAKGVTR